VRKASLSKSVEVKSAITLLPQMQFAITMLPHFSTLIIHL